MAESLGTILEFTENLKDAEAPEPLPKSDYPFTVSGAENGVGTSGKPRIDVTLNIAPEDFPPDYVDAADYPEGKQVHYYLASEDTKKNRWRIREFATAIGAKLGAKIDVNDWIGKKGTVTVDHDDFEGVMRERAQKITSL